MKQKKAFSLAYFLWCCIHVILAIASIIINGLHFFDGALMGFWPFFKADIINIKVYKEPAAFTIGNSYVADYTLDFQYTIDEFLIYTGVPLLLYWIWRKIERKAFPSDKNVS